MSIALKPFIKAFKPEKLNYELLRVDGGVHMRGIYFPEETAIRPGPVWQLGKGLSSEKYRPSSEELAALKTQLNIELDKLLL